MLVMTCHIMTTVVKTNPATKAIARIKTVILPHLLFKGFLYTGSMIFFSFLTRFLDSGIVPPLFYQHATSILKKGRIGKTLRRPYRIIFHIDLNAFFASCEMAVNPALKKVPLGIGGHKDRGVLTTANYVARQFGVTSAMPVAEAKRRCPQLVVYPVNFPLYKEKSQAFFDYLKGITDYIEPASIDEAYLDLTDILEHQDPVALAQKIQHDLKTLHDLPCSIGIAPNKFLAKMASDHKKPEGITIFRKREVKEVLWPYPIEAMHGIGAKTVPNLKLLGINTIGDLAQYADLQKLSKFLGASTEAFQGRAWGHDESPVDPGRDQAQSIGQSRTFDPPLFSIQEVLNELEVLTLLVHERLIDADLKTKSLSIGMRNQQFETRSKQTSLPYHTDDVGVLLETMERLVDALHEDTPVALVSVSASHLEKKERLADQINLFDVSQFPSRTAAIEDTLKKINAHYDKSLLKRGFNDES